MKWSMDTWSMFTKSHDVKWRSDTFWQKFKVWHEEQMRKLERTTRGASDWLHPPAERQIQSQTLIYGTVILMIWIPPITLSISGGGQMDYQGRRTDRRHVQWWSFASPRSNQTLKPDFPSPLTSPPFSALFFWSESFWQWCISLCSTGLAGWQEMPQIPRE